MRRNQNTEFVILYRTRDVAWGWSYRKLWTQADHPSDRQLLFRMQLLSAFLFNREKSNDGLHEARYYIARAQHQVELVNIVKLALYPEVMLNPGCLNQAFRLQ